MTTWNPSDKTANETLSNGNLSVTATTSSDGGVRSTTSKTNTKDYMEFTYSGSSIPAGDNGVGIVTGGQSLSTVGASAANAFLTYTTGSVWTSGANSIAAPGIGATAIGDVVCMAIDRVNEKGWFRKNNGNWNGSPTANPATTTGGVNLGGVFTSDFALVCTGGTTFTVTANFGASPYSFTIPSGFSSWDPQNIAYTISPVEGVYTLTGESVSFSAAKSILATQGTYTLTGKTVTLTSSRNIFPVQGTYTLTGESVSFLKGKLLSVAQGVYILAGKAVALNSNRSIFPTRGLYSLTGNSVTFSNFLTHVLSPITGIYNLLKNSISLTKTSPQPIPPIVSDYNSFSLWSNNGPSWGSRRRTRLKSWITPIFK